MSQLPLFVFLDLGDVSIQAAKLKGLCEVKGLGVHSLEEIPDWIETVPYIGVWHSLKLKEDTLKRFKACKVLVRMGVGYDNVDVDAAGRLGIRVCNIPAYGTEEVADTALTLMLSLFRQTASVNVKVRAGLVIRNSDDTIQHAPFARRLRGSVLGCLGLGAIGSALALRASALGMRIIFFDPYVSDGTAKALNAVRVDDIHDLARQSNCVAINCKLTHETHNMVGKEFLAEMQRGSFVVNTGRGGIVDEAALYEALVSGHIGGAGLDVTEVEPVTTENPLLALPNVILTPHIAWFSQESMIEMYETSADTIKLHVLGKPLRNVVNSAHFPRSA
eukprot:m.71466 g.71466  ORF g.71466 m.71466 type:complete len:333 (-) comp50182_c0_seq4:115-1113(-)